MSLIPFSIIVAIDSANGIAKDGEIPWNSREDMRFFRDTTIGKGKNAVIFGRLTYETIDEDHRPLEKRRNVVLSRKMKQDSNPNILIFGSLVEALAGLGQQQSAYEDVFICGGEQVYNEVLRDYLYLCKRIYVTKFKNDYACDQFFNFEAIKDLPQAQEPTKTNMFTRYVFSPSIRHDEYHYLTLLNNVLTNGEARPDRTGVGTKSMFAQHIEFDIRERLPLVTTKKLNYEAVIKELLFFISGSTNTKRLEEQGVNIWKGNTSKEYLAKYNLPYEEGDMGPGYGHQWRHWGAEYHGATVDYKGKGVDQLKTLIDGIRNDPHSRRHILSGWNVSQLKEMCLPPCHLLSQFYVSSDRKFLDCQLYCRSSDLFLGLPFNIASYAILTYMIGHVTNLKPRRLIINIGDAHLYLNHLEQANRQLKRTPRPFPKLSFRQAAKLQEIDDFTLDNFMIEGYTSWQHISAEMSA